MNEDDSAIWDDSYLIGHEVIDSQHKELVRMTNELFKGCARGSTAADIAFIRTVRNAVEYAQTHFYTEEKYLKQVNYPDFPAHKKEHETFVATLRAAVREFEEEKSAPINLARYLKKWLLNHIAVTDRKYIPFLLGV